MSGIAGVLRLDGRPADRAELERMVEVLRRRGPDGSGTWQEGTVALGHSALVTTPEARDERQPIVAAEGDLVIVADARLDNRDELLDRWRLRSDRTRTIGDGELILRAFREWGAGCPERLLGDFAFAVWDRQAQRLFCARDHFGVRPFIYHHAPGRLLVWASEVGAVLAAADVPRRLNEGRVADFLVTRLEGIDRTSTFFEDVHRLPPAHTLTVTPGGLTIRRYWRPEAGAELRLGSDEEYAEAFLDVFTEAVRSRLRGTDVVGSMLSGGMDSGSVVAVARQLRAAAGDGPLPTFSAVGPDPDACVETAAIHAALAMEGLEPHLVSHARLDELLPDLAELTAASDEPFDAHMTLVRAIDLDAHRNGVKALLDGIDGDTLLAPGSQVVRLIRGGRWLTAYREVAGEQRFYGQSGLPVGSLLRAALGAFAPPPARRLVRTLRSSRPGAAARREVAASIIDPDFAKRVALADRLEALAAHSRRDGRRLSLGEERARSLDHPYLTVGIERYDRTAAAVAVEPRHPFLDLGVVAFCLALPGAQRLGGGWPKAILRRAMAGRLPDEVRWRRGKQHLGWAFTRALMGATRPGPPPVSGDDERLLAGFVDLAKLAGAVRACADQPGSMRAEEVDQAAYLASWLRRQRRWLEAGPRPEP